MFLSKIHEWKAYAITDIYLNIMFLTPQKMYGASTMCQMPFLALRTEQNQCPPASWAAERDCRNVYKGLVCNVI